MKKKYDFVVGVPCSKLKDFTDKIENYIPSTKEDEAIYLAVGAYLTGKKPLVFLQNSGLGFVISPIISLLKPYNIKIDLLVSVRKNPKHHAFMGKVTKKLLKDIEYTNVKFIEEWDINITNPEEKQSKK